MRLSVPNIPTSVLSKAALRKAESVSSSEAVQRLTGAGVSVDSGVKAYRGKDGRYMNPDYKCAHRLAMSAAPSRTYVAHCVDWVLRPIFVGNLICSAPLSTLLIVMYLVPGAH